MTIADFKKLVQDYMCRNSATFDVGGAGGQIDKILAAANRAKAFAQKKIRFELAKEYVTVSVAKLGGSTLSDCKLASDGVTSVRVRSVCEAFLESTVTPGQWDPIDFVDRAVQLQRLRKDQGVPASQLVKDGKYLWLIPWPDETVTTITAKMRVFQWLKDYDDSVVTSDFFLVECQDWMLFRTIQDLNFFLKEDQRVALSDAVVKEHWDAMVRWNSELAGSDADMELD